MMCRDLLELKEIQRSLPIADQPPDPLAGRAGRRYLTGVPIALVPLLPESDSTTSQPSPTTPTPTSPAQTSPWAAFSPTSRQSPTSPPFRGFQPTPNPSNLSHLPPSRPQVPKPNPRFAFLPLLDSPTGSTPSGPNASRSRTPSPARSDPPTPSLTNTSLESSPMSQASTCSSSDPPFFQLPPPKKRFAGYCQDEDGDSFPQSLTSAMQSMKMQPPPQGAGSTPRPPFPFEPNHSTNFGRSNPAFRPAYTVPNPAYAQPKPKKQRNVIVVNGIEIDLDGDDSPTPAPPPPKLKKKKNVIVVNGIEMDLDGSDDEEEQPKPSTPQPRSPVSSPPRSSPSSPSSITSNGLPTPPPSTSPSPTLTQRKPLPPTDDSPFSGLHAPIRFKRAAPAPAPSSSSSMTTAYPSCSPPRAFLSSSPSQRRGSFGSRQQQ